MAEPARRDLYERDFYAWTQDQAARLRALAGDNRFDVAHVAEEIADLGKRDRRALAKNAKQALVHLIMLAASPVTEPRQHWADEVDEHRDDMRALLGDSPSMANKVDIEAVWQDAVRTANRKLSRYGEPMVSLPDACPITLADLTNDDREVLDLVERIRDDIVGRGNRSPD